MDEQYKDLLLRKINKFRGHVVFEGKLKALLLANKIFDEDEIERIESKQTNGDRVYELVTRLVKKPSPHYHKFVRCLRSSGYEQLADELENDGNPVERKLEMLNYLDSVFGSQTIDLPKEVKQAMTRDLVPTKHVDKQYERKLYNLKNTINLQTQEMESLKDMITDRSNYIKKLEKEISNSREREQTLEQKVEEQFEKLVNRETHFFQEIDKLSQQNSQYSKDAKKQIKKFRKYASEIEDQLQTKSELTKELTLKLHQSQVKLKQLEEESKEKQKLKNAKEKLIREKERLERDKDMLQEKLNHLVKEKSMLLRNFQTLEEQLLTSVKSGASSRDATTHNETKNEQMQLAPKSQKFCLRCKSNVNSNMSNLDPCRFHPLRYDSRQRKWECCKAPYEAAPGCTVKSWHKFDEKQLKSNSRFLYDH